MPSSTQFPGIWPAVVLEPKLPFYRGLFFVNRSNSRRLLLLYGKGSPRISTYSDPQCLEKLFYLKSLIKGLAGNQPRFRIPPSQELSDYLDDELIKAIRGLVTPRAALDRTAARWREILMQSGHLHESTSP